MVCFDCIPRPIVFRKVLAKPMYNCYGELCSGAQYGYNDAEEPITNEEVKEIENGPERKGC